MKPGKYTCTRGRILKTLQGRRVLILICTLVVIECICVMAELMVDLQGIRIRFENEEKEVNEFLAFMKSRYPTTFDDFRVQSLEELLVLLRDSTQLWDKNKTMESNCACPKTDATLRKKRSYGFDYRKVLSNKEEFISRKIDAMQKMAMKTSLKLQTETYPENENERQSNDYKLPGPSPQGQFRPKTLSTSADVQDESYYFVADDLLDDVEKYHNITIYGYKENNKEFQNIPYNERNNEKKIVPTRTRTLKKRESGVGNENSRNSQKEVFVFTINNEKETFHLVSEFINLTDEEISKKISEEKEKYDSYYKEYEQIQLISHAIHYCGLSIMSLMLAETIVKMSCLGIQFFKKKFEVFDACIVMISFVLDLVFLDNRWYESGKDATTIVVLLLPWRVVRIVNSFVMTIKHKHHIQIMNIRRAKKKAEIKLEKLRNLTEEIRRDVDLLISLCRSKGANDNEVDSCIYGRGRGTTTLAAITSFASLMVISTLGKNPSPSDYNDVYNSLFSDVLNADDEEEDDNPKIGKVRGTNQKVEFDFGSEESETCVDDPEEVAGHTDALEGKRRNTVPPIKGGHGERRSIFYVNDAYLNNNDDAKCRHAASLYGRNSVRASLPTINAPPNNYVKSFVPESLLPVLQ